MTDSSATATITAHFEAGTLARPTAAPEAALFSECVFFPGLLGVTRGIIIRVSGVRVPPPLLHRLFKQKELDNVLQEQEGEYEPDTRFAVVWFEQHGFEAGEFGTAETLATAKAISVDGVVDAGILHSAGGPTAECLPPRRCL